jgi:hypothetical protein
MDTAADSLKEPVLIDKAVVSRLLSQYGLTDEQVHTLLQVSSIVNEAAIVLLNNYLHPDAPIQLDPKAMLSFRVHQTDNLTKNEKEERRLGQIFEQMMPHSDYIKFSVSQGYLSQARFDWLTDHTHRLYWKRGPRGDDRKVKLKFRPEPILSLSSLLPICRVALSCGPDGNYYLQWSRECEKTLRERTMYVAGRPARCRMRLGMYVQRYGIQLIAQDGSPITVDDLPVQRCRRCPQHYYI